LEGCGGKRPDTTSVGDSSRFARSASRSVAPRGPSRDSIRASGLDARARRDAAAEAEDAAAGAMVRVGGAWVTPGPRAFLGSRRTSDTGALSTSVFVASASTTGDVMAKA